ncbi:MAG: hypothetical protein A2542_02375 [Parcubacteria group bacterium RIFOXYD2_FULL_52_8]|nr:MAG: hypothetical protein A2542_02375 [Parcubacteria group bacterium RIFOXYD2_FULL_52_8]
MKLLLTSNGIVNEELQGALERLTGGRKDLRVAIIPTAGEPIEWVPDAPGSKHFTPHLTGTPLFEVNPTESPAYKAWQDRGFSNICFVSLRDDPQKIKEDLERAEVIDIPGGDPDYLELWAKQSGLDRYWKELVRGGKICVTSSAGAALLGPGTRFRWWTPEEPMDQEDVDRFALVNFVPIVHQKEDDPEKNYDALVTRKEYMKANFPGGFPWPLYLIPDGQAVLVAGDIIEQVGPGQKRII